MNLFTITHGTTTITIDARLSSDTEWVSLPADILATIIADVDAGHTTGGPFSPVTERSYYWTTN